MKIYTASTEHTKVSIIYYTPLYRDISLFTGLGIVSGEFVLVVEIASYYLTLSNVGHDPQISARHIELSSLTLYSIHGHSSFCNFLINWICFRISAIGPYILGRAIAQAVSRWLPTAAARVRTRIRSCGICGGRSGGGAGFLRVLRFLLPTFIPPIAPQSPSSIIWSWYNRPIVASVISGLSLTPLIIIKK
jgi:hypothetical protein